MLRPLEQAILVAVDRLTRDTYGETDSGAVAGELVEMGHQIPAALIYARLFGKLRDEGYLLHATTIMAGGQVRHIELTDYGRELAHADVDPMERVYSEAHRLLGSDEFAAAYPGAFQPWADAERLLLGDNAERELTAIGHKVREAAQAFATEILDKYGGDNPPDDVKAVKRRLGAVIAQHRDQLGEKRRKMLEALGDLWEATVDLVERQEHAAQKEGEPVTWQDGRRIVSLTMFLMVEFATIFEELPEPPVATLEGASGIGSTAFLEGALQREHRERGP